MGVRRMRKGWLITLCIVVSVALVGAALLALAAILRDLSASEALRQAMEAFRDGSAPPMALTNMISM